MIILKLLTQTFPEFTDLPTGCKCMTFMPKLFIPGLILFVIVLGIGITSKYIEKRRTNKP